MQLKHVVGAVAIGALLVLALFQAGTLEFLGNFLFLLGRGLSAVQG